MEYRNWALTGLNVSPLGFGAGHVGSPDMTEDDAGTLLNRALDRGINVVDTARGYGLSEERIGRHLSWRRQDYHLITKVGYQVEGVEDWTGEAVERGLEQALVRLKTDRVEAVLLHSCPAEVFTRDAVLRALERVRQRGLAQLVGYSGEGSDLDAALASGAFQVFETSVNLVDQGWLDRDFVGGLVPALVAKRPLANAFWRFADQPVGQYAEVYWVRWKTWALEQWGMPLDELALRFALSFPEAGTAIVGTGNIANLEHNTELAEKGPLPDEVVARLRNAWRPYRSKWVGQV
jgi:aryl-alcohol dehydrogenase-like predicted oxidoreductase